MFSADKDEAVSRDIGELQQVVRINIPAKSIKWEIFGTPEDKGAGAPGPTDYITLVAEVENPDNSWIASLRDNAANEWIAPESARPWLSPYFQTLLKGARTNKSGLNQCKKYQVELTKTRKLVDGFVCQHKGTLLIHVMLLGPSANSVDLQELPVFE